MNSREKGRAGEELAVRYLKSKGYTILKRNYKGLNSEIDIIAGHGEFIVFIEVKLRTNLSKGAPYESVNRLKQKKIAFAAMKYIADNPEAAQSYRFDIIDIITDQKYLYETAKVRHFENAFDFP